MQHEKRAFRTLRLLTHCESDTFIAQTRIYIFASNIFKFIAILFFFLHIKREILPEISCEYILNFVMC